VLTPVNPCASALDPLNLPFTDFSIAMAHLALCTNLLSANSTFLVPYLSMVLRLLFSSTDDGSEKSTKRIGIIHQTLSYATILVPNAADELKTQLPQVAPFKRANTDVLTHYTKQLLRITTYIPILTSTAISAILLKCTEIDVEIHIHDNGDTSIHEDTLLDEHEIMFEMDPTTGSETDRALKAKLSRTRAMSIEAGEWRRARAERHEQRGEERPARSDRRIARSERSEARSRPLLPRANAELGGTVFVVGRAALTALFLCSCRV